MSQQIPMATALPVGQPVTMGQPVKPSPGLDYGADSAPGAPPAGVLQATNAGISQPTQPKRGEPCTDVGFRDKWWAVVWCVMVVSISVIALALGAPTLSESGSDDDDAGSSDCTSDFCRESNTALGLVVAMTLCAIAASGCWVALMLQFAETLVYFVMILGACFMGVLLISMAATGGTTGLVFMLIFAAIFGWLWCRLKRYVPFAAANLAIACKAVSAHKTVVTISLLMCLAQLAWIVLWVLAYIGADSTTSNVDSITVDYGLADDDVNETFQRGDCTDSAVYSNTCECTNSDGDSYTFADNCEDTFTASLSSGAVFILLFCYYWGSVTIRYVIHTTVCGAVGAWWFQAPDRDTASVSALKRACTTSFGSIAFGAALVAFVKTLRALLRNNNRGSCVALCLACLLRYLERFLELINSYAFVYVAFYGKPFWPAAKEVKALFVDRGFTAILSNYLIDLVLGLGVFCIAAFTGFLGYAFGEAQDLTTLWIVLLVLIGVLLGWIIGSQVMGVIDSATNACFVAFAEDPNGLGSHQPELLQKMLVAWEGLQPGFCYAYMIVQQQPAGAAKV